MQLVDPNTLELCHSKSRLRHRFREHSLLDSMIESGVLSPLVGVSLPNGENVLLDGFKRHRIAKVIGMTSVPFESLADTELGGIVEFLRRNTISSINILEQSAFIEYLSVTYEMSVGQIAQALAKSKAWVSLRRTLLSEISETVRRRVFADQFPVYAYMYFLRPFMRLNEVTSAQVDTFVEAVSCKGLSTREIERLAYGYFRGPDEFKNHIDRGEIAWALRRSQGVFSGSAPSCSATEIMVLQQLERLDRDIAKVRSDLMNDKLNSNAFFAQAELLIERLLGCQPAFFKSLRDFHDRPRDTQSSLLAP